METEEPGNPFEGRISQVTGRGTVTGGRGLPKIAEMAFTRADGSTIKAKLRAFLTGSQHAAQRVCLIDGGTFPYCPICFDAQADSREHVPPKQFGGSVMANACSSCNNKLGSRTESAMLDWFDGAVHT